MPLKNSHSAKGLTFLSSYPLLLQGAAPGRVPRMRFSSSSAEPELSGLVGLRSQTRRARARHKAIQGAACAGCRLAVPGLAEVEGPEPGELELGLGLGLGLEQEWVKVSTR